MSEIKLVKHHKEAEKDKTKSLLNLPCPAIFTKKLLKWQCWVLYIEIT